MHMNTDSFTVIKPASPLFRKFASVTLSVAVAVAGLFLTNSGALADDATNNVSKADQEFILAAAQGGMTEVKLGELAAQNASRQDLKDFGTMMVTDHTKINTDLKALATQKGVTVPDSIDAKHQAMVDKLNSKSGEDFDKAYVAAMIKAHKHDLKAFQSESDSTQDPDVKTFVQNAIPTISAHVQHIQDLKSGK